MSEKRDADMALKMRQDDEDTMNKEQERLKKIQDEDEAILCMQALCPGVETQIARDNLEASSWNIMNAIDKHQNACTLNINFTLTESGERMQHSFTQDSEGMEIIMYLNNYKMLDDKYYRLMKSGNGEGIITYLDLS
jgi:preprotein translocase subunit SecD